MSDSTSFTHQFVSPGTVVVKLKVTDTGMQSDSVTRSVEVPPDSMPTASYAVDCTGLACTLDGSDSTDDHGVVDYTWYVQGDSVASSAQSTVLYTFPNTGQYFVSLRVKDGAGQTAWSRGTVLVGDPVATFALSGQCDTDHWCTFSASGSSAPGGVRRYVWHVDGDSIRSLSHPNTTWDHDFRSLGEYRVQLTVVGSGSGRLADTTRVLHITSDSSWVTDVTETDAAPVAAFAASCAGRACTFDGSGSSDDVGIETYAWSVTAGDSSVATGSSLTLAHRFASDGTYGVRLIVTDSASQADTVSRNVMVEDLPPVAGFTVACDSRACVFDGSTSTDDLGIAQYAWTVDGNSVGTVTEDTLAYTFDSVGTYGVRLRVSDTAVPAQTSDSTRQVVVGGTPPPATRPDLGVGAPTVSDRAPETGASFTLSATVTNAGDGASAPTTLRYYRSADATISTSDTSQGTDAVGALAAGGTSAESISLTAPPAAGTYYYGACVDPVSGESDTGDNCSTSVRVDVEAPTTRPNLGVGTPTVSDRAPVTGTSFTLSATVTNAGDGASAATTLRYYRSADATIDSTDAAAGTDAVAGLAAAGTSAESISVTAPLTSGTYYYGACVDPVPGESDTRDNCSASVRVDVDGPPTAILGVTCSGRDCTLDGSNSTDDKGITDYAWAVDGTEVASGDSTSVEHAFASNGTYEVVLTVTDTKGQTGSATESVTVADNPPTASFTYGCKGLTCTFDASGSSDDVGIAGYTWSFLEGPRAPDTTPTRTHTFSSAGSWQVTLNVQDTAGQTGSTSQSIDVTSSI
ncbi:PKD domain-containing protein [Candidatus Palauibacter sp.]|uniref:PKD domain-containing protein n=1 Tax=Candidatus Palauibacter sp. TaxID=3101350 RepID=UPI003B5994BE